MFIVLYNGQTNKVYLCSDNMPLQQFDSTDDSWINKIPSHEKEIIYVTSGYLSKKEQLSKIISKKFNCTVKTPQKNKENYLQKNTWYIHPKHNGSVEIRGFDKLIKLKHKWDFININQLGGIEKVQENNFIKTLIGKNKIEIVNEDYYQKNKHKAKQKDSDESLDRILVPEGVKAEDFDGSMDMLENYEGNMSNTNESIEFTVED